MKYLSLALLCCCLACSPSDKPAPASVPTLLPETETPIANDETIRSADGTPLLRTFSLADSVRLMPDTLSPMALYRIDGWLAASPRSQLNKVINSAIGRAIAGEEAPMRVKDLPRTLEAFVRGRLKAYRQQEIDRDLLASSPTAYAREHHFKTEVRYQNDRLLTLATNHYYYVGGAHGNHYTQLHIFDLPNAKALKFSDLFRSGAEEELTEALRAHADSTPEDFRPTKNVGLTEAGFVFNYPPYEIGAYADGEIEIILPYAAASDYLTERGRALLEQR